MQVLVYCKSDQYKGCDYYGDNWEFFVKGLDGHPLTTMDREICMGENNRAFVLDYPYDESIYWSYWNNYFGGTLTFDVDLSEVDCACAAGVYLVQLDDENCSWDAKGADVTPQCSSIDIMEANIWGYKTTSHPCEFGSCDAQSASTATVNWTDGSYGANDYYRINASQPYNVQVKFWANQSNELVKIETTLTQGSEVAVLVQDNADYLAPLASKLSYQMAMGVSSYNLDINNDIGGQCTEQCSTQNTRIRNLDWTMGDSIISDEYLERGPAPRLDNCEAGCTECREFSWTSTPDQPEYVCTDFTVYKYGNICSDTADRSKCNTDDDQLCHKSYPHGDDDKMNSVDAACRTIPAENIEGDFMYAKKECRQD